jgi:hypothetical protein
MSEQEKVKNYKVQLKGRISTYSAASPSINMGGQGYSSDESDTIS